MEDKTLDDSNLILDEILDDFNIYSHDVVDGKQTHTQIQPKLAKQQILAWHSAELDKAVNNKLQSIANNNYDNMHGTYDFDGIAEDLLAEAGWARVVK